MSRLASFFASERELLRLRREVGELRRENARLQEQNDSMRQGMRRCVTCDYRLDFKRRQGAAPVAADTGAPTIPNTEPD